MSFVVNNNKLLLDNNKPLSLDSFIQMANNVTHMNDTMLTNAINNLIAGYGGAQVVTVDIVPDNDVQINSNAATMPKISKSTGVNKIPTIIIMLPINLAEWIEANKDNLPTTSTTLGFIFLKTNLPFKQSYTTTLNATVPGEFSLGWVGIIKEDMTITMNVKNSTSYNVSTDTNSDCNHIIANRVSIPRLASTVYARKGLCYKFYCIYDINLGGDLNANQT